MIDTSSSLIDVPPEKVFQWARELADRIRATLIWVDGSDVNPKVQLTEMPWGGLVYHGISMQGRKDHYSLSAVLKPGLSIEYVSDLSVFLRLLAKDLGGNPKTIQEFSNTPSAQMPDANPEDRTRAWGLISVVWPFTG